MDRINKNINYQCLSIYKKPHVSLTRRPEVTFIQEPAVDAGSLTKEYFCIGMMALIKEPLNAGDGSYPLFEGKPDHKLPTPNPFLQQCGMYVAVGKFIAHSIVHGGPGLVGVSQVLKDYLITGETEELTPVSDDIPDLDLCTLVKEIQTNSSSWVENAKSWIDLSEQILPYLVESEFPYILSLCNVGLAAWHLMCFFVINKRHKQFKDIRQGMETTSLCSFLKQQPQFCRDIFPEASDFTSTQEIARLICPSTDVEGCNAFTFLLEYVKQLNAPKEIDEPTPTTRHLLQFWNGDYSAAQKLNVELLTDSERTLPESRACFQCLQLPTCHQDFESFKKAMHTALIFGSQGYGKF